MSAMVRLLDMRLKLDQSRVFDNGSHSHNEDSGA